MTNVQCYCSVVELMADAENVHGLPDDVLGRFILPASQYLAQEIGPFLPVMESVRFTGDSSSILFVPALLRLTANIENDGDVVTSQDVVLRSSEQSSRPAWPNGPYLRIDPDPDNTAIGAWSTDRNSVVVPGVWGFYERTEPLGIVLSAQQTVSAETVTVSDGSKLSAGVVLSINSEMQIVRGYGAPSAAVTTLAQAMNGTDEEITLANGALVKIGEIVRVGFERLKVLDLAGNKAHVARGWDRTKKVSHDSASGVDVYRTFAVTRACNGSTAQVHESGAALARYAVPDDVNYLTRQVATLMIKKAQTGYSGRSGNPESGESFYMYEFPRDAIARVKSNYYIAAVR